MPILRIPGYLAFKCKKEASLVLVDKRGFFRGEDEWT